MKILLVFDAAFPVNVDSLRTFLKTTLTHLEIDIYINEFQIDDELISKPSTFNKIHKRLDTKQLHYDRFFCFTTKQYTDNYFFHEHNHLAIFSFYKWNYLTDLPYSNGVVYFIADYIALEIDNSDFRHTDVTGCIYDFLGSKKGIDTGMRQARFCPNCQERVTGTITDDLSMSLFNDLKSLMDLLSNASRWNRDILEQVVIKDKLVRKRKPKNGTLIQVVVASPGDTEAERKVLLDSLERKFRTDNHESHCGFRVIVNGWEDLASQNGYPQDVINKKIIEQSDFVVAVFKHKLGTPTKDAEGNVRAESGTAEELLQTLDYTVSGHPIGMAYFYSKAPIISLDAPDKEQIERDWIRLSKFKQSIQDKMIYKPYTDTTELLSVVLKDLEKNIIEYIQK